MSAPKFNSGSNVYNVNTHNSTAKKYKTICKKFIVGSDAHVKLDALISEVEAEGYEYYDNIPLNINEKIIIFKKTV